MVVIHQLPIPHPLREQCSYACSLHIKIRLARNLRYLTLKIVFCFFFFQNRVISVISFVLRETTLTILISTGDLVSMESEIVRVVSLSRAEISELPLLKIRSSGPRYLNNTAKEFNCTAAKQDKGRRT